MLIVLCLNNMANYLKTDIRCLSAVNGAQNNTSYCQSDWNEADYFIVLCGLNAEVTYDDCFNNNNIIMSILF